MGSVGVDIDPPTGDGLDARRPLRGWSIAVLGFAVVLIAVPFAAWASAAAPARASALGLPAVSISGAGGSLGVAALGLALGLMALVTLSRRPSSLQFAALVTTASAALVLSAIVAGTRLDRAHDAGVALMGVCRICGTCGLCGNAVVRPGVGLVASLVSATLALACATSGLISARRVERAELCAPADP